MKNKLLALFFFCYSFSIQAHEGMWLPLLIEQQIFPAMQQAGCKLTPEQIYSVNQASLKDAIVRIGNGCSGGFLSKNGLVITNHHCVQYFITQASTTANNYLEKGFWAYSQSEELQAKGLSISVLLEMRDVSNFIIMPQDSSILHTDLQAIRQERIKKIIDSANQENPLVTCAIESFWGGNQYFLFMSRTYTDIRLVGFPPVNMGSFGGDVDNWEWPRHSADFALLRVYADSVGMPSAHIQSNIPLQPKKYLHIEAQGIQPGDFTMVMGYPASTSNYALSTEIESTFRYLNPMQIQLRSLRLAPIKAYMNENQTAYLQYYSRYDKLTNYYKKWQGEQFGIEKSQAIERAKQFEQNLQFWILQDSLRSAKYATLLSDYRKAYIKYFNSYYGLMAYVESYWKMDFFVLGEKFLGLYNDTEKTLKSIQNQCDLYYANNTMSIEKQSFPQVMKALDTLLASYQLPIEYASMTVEQREAYIAQIIQQSVLFNKNKSDAFLKKLYMPKNKKSAINLHILLDSDPGVLFVKQTLNHLRSALYKDYLQSSAELDSIQQVYFSCLFDYKGSTLSPDANSTMRVSFGNVLPYKTADAVTYYAQTTAKGIPQKWNSGKQEYSYNAKLDSLLQLKVYGNFSSDTLFVNFVASNQTSGGNSGSPVLNAYGNFIGINFDRNKEGTMSDIYFDERFCRNISVDVRYILFCIEVYGNAHNIIQELEFVNHINN